MSMMRAIVLGLEQKPESRKYCHGTWR